MPFFRKSRREMIERATFMINGIKDDYKDIFMMLRGYINFQKKNDT